MKATMGLIQKLRNQLPPEALEKLDEIEGMLGDEEEPADGMPADLGMDLDSEEAPELGEGEGEEEEEDLDVAPAMPMAGKKKPSKKPSFFS